MSAAFHRSLLQVLCYKFVTFKITQNDINQPLFVHVTGGQTVAFDHFFWLIAAPFQSIKIYFPPQCDQ